MKYFLLILIPILVIHYYVASPSTSSSTQYLHTTVKILDGDTFIYNKEHIRLIGMNAPEIDHWDKASQCWAYQSMSRLEYYLTRIRPASMLRIERKGTDKYWRTLALVYVDTDPVSVNSRLVKEWFAEPFRPEYGVPAPNFDDQYKIAIENLAGNLSHCNP